MTRLKTTVKTDILSTLKSFEVGDSEFIKYSDSGTDVRTFSSRCYTLKRDGLLDGEFHFFRVQNPRGVVIVRVK